MGGDERSLCELMRAVTDAQVQMWLLVRDRDELLREACLQWFAADDALIEALEESLDDERRG